jgi:hypothetical protein
MTEPEMEAGSQGRTARLVGFFASLVASLFLWFLLATRFPIGKVLAYWFWKPTTAPRPAWWLIFLAITCMLGLILFVRRSKLSIAANLVVIILVGFAPQHAFGLMEGRGLSGVRDRMLRAGHTSFARDAVKKMDLLEVARDYEELIERRELSRYPNSTKPPGQLLVYMLTERISRAFPQLGTNALLRMATLASLLYPFLTYLTVIPLYALSRLHLDGKAAYVPAVVFLCLPNVTLMSLHLDQCLYPLLFTSALALFSYGYRQQGTLLLVLSGVEGVGHRPARGTQVFDNGPGALCGGLCSWRSGALSLPGLSHSRQPRVCHLQPPRLADPGPDCKLAFLYRLARHRRVRRLDRATCRVARGITYGNIVESHIPRRNEA